MGRRLNPPEIIPLEPDPDNTGGGRYEKSSYPIRFNFIGLRSIYGLQKIYKI